MEHPPPRKTRLDDSSPDSHLDLRAPDAARERLERGLRELGLAPGSGRIAALLRLAELLASWSRRINLTGHRSLESIVQRLVLDAAAISSRVPAPEALSSLADLGSGAGFPGIPLAILWPHCRVTLVEARQKRHHFQRHALRELDLGNVRPLLGRAEELAPTPHDAVIAQAAARPAIAVRWLLRWAGPGALLLLPGAEEPPQVPEIKEVSFERLERYRVPGGGPQRTLWMGRATGSAGRSGPACGT